MSSIAAMMRPTPKTRRKKRMMRGAAGTRAALSMIQKRRVKSRVFNVSFTSTVWLGYWAYLTMWAGEHGWAGGAGRNIKGLLQNQFAAPDHTFIPSSIA